MIEQWITSVCSEAGWDRPSINIEGKYRFRLESDMAVDASSLDERTIVLEAAVKTLEQHGGEVFLKKAGSAVLPRVFKDNGTLSWLPGTKTVYLHQVVTLGALRASDFPGVMENFINTLAFYKSL